MRCSSHQSGVWDIDGETDKFSGKTLSSWDFLTVLDAQEPAAGEDGPEMLGTVK